MALGRRLEVNGEARSFGWRNQVGVGDIDGDGKLDVVSTAYSDRHLSVYKPAALQDHPKILKMIKASPVKLESGEQLLPPHAGGNNNGDYMTKLADWDGDGDLDLLQGTLYHIWYYENVGTKKTLVFRSHDKIIVEGKPLMVSGHAGSVDAVDWNADGRLDIVIGGESGWTFYFERSFIDGNLPRAEIKGVELRP